MEVENGMKPDVIVTVFHFLLVSTFQPEPRKAKMNNIRNKGGNSRQRSEMNLSEMIEFNRVIPQRTDKIVPSFLERLIRVLPDREALMQVTNPACTRYRPYFNSGF